MHGQNKPVQSASLCVTCPRRDKGFCGVLLGSEGSHAGGRSSWQHHQTVPAGKQIATRYEASEDIFVVCGGWGYRFFQMPDGRKHILNFLLPGDLFSATSIFEERFHFSVKALTEMQISGMRRSEVRARLNDNPEVCPALAKIWNAESEASDEMLAALGRSSAEERIAHLLLQLMKRVAARNVIRDQRYPMPLRQQHIADAVGLTAVHVSRVFSTFRERGIFELSDGVLKVHDLAQMERLGALY